MERVSRRDLLAGGTALGISALARPVFADPAPPARGFRFVHFTDIHIQPELSAPEGVALAVKRLRELTPRPDFVLLGGDHVMDLLSVTRERADVQFRLLTEALKPLDIPVYSTIGNHDVYGWSKGSPATVSDPLYGIRMFEEKFSHRPAYFSFDHKGWHFVVLNSIQPKGEGWTSRIDDDQLTWLANDLGKTTRPTVVMTHVPILTIFVQYATGTLVPNTGSIIVENGREVQQILAKHPVKAVLQGHTHSIEECSYLGTRYITSGAVCGEWWKGPRLGVHPEGFMVFDVKGDALTNHYVPSGWTAKAG